MKANIDNSVKEMVDLFEIKTPTDNRTSERKWLRDRTKEVKNCKDTEYGYFSFLRMKDINLLTTFCEN